MSELISVAEGVSMLNKYAQRAKDSGAILVEQHKMFQLDSKLLQGLISKIVDSKTNLKAQNAYLLYKFGCKPGQGMARKHTFENLEINMGGLLEMPDGRFILMPEFYNLNEKAFVNFENRALPHSNNFMKLKNDKVNERGGVSTILNTKSLFLLSKMIETSPFIYIYPAVSSKPKSQPNFAENFTDVVVSNKGDLLKLDLSKARLVDTSEYMVMDRHSGCCPPQT
jgi:hypothetical protein